MSSTNRTRTLSTVYHVPRRRFVHRHPSWMTIEVDPVDVRTSLPQISRSLR